MEILKLFNYYRVLKIKSSTRYYTDFFKPEKMIIKLILYTIHRINFENHLNHGDIQLTQNADRNYIAIQC